MRPSFHRRTKMTELWNFVFISDSWNFWNFSSTWNLHVITKAGTQIDIIILSAWAVGCKPRKKKIWKKSYQLRNFYYGSFLKCPKSMNFACFSRNSPESNIPIQIWKKTDCHKDEMSKQGFSRNGSPSIYINISE